ncbi:sodium/hydrogen exchanger 9 isoform X1 [Kryptolebias marmoratus]|uniref:sodium/hydrogen exchanger 9 isoform X1 n=1 Tax=Kryptolebias marmoratus TaxID=37003 RepID=UPI000D52F327|nr:sodium/hydrogen exchanger 9 isoform X1 [Kryptolebias marmoratus]
MSAAARHRPDSAALFVLAAVSLALLTILSVWKLKQFKYRLINETGGAMFYGMLLGLLVKYVWFDREEHGKNMGSVCTCHGLNGTVCVTTVNDTSHQHIGKNSRRCSFVSMGTFDPEVLFDLFLPAVIFYGAYTLNQKRLIQNLGSVVTYAFLGTLISCICIGACMYGFTRLVVLLKPTADGKFFLTDCLLFGAIMSATDPVSVLGLLSDLRVDFDLRTLLFGESVLNDAVAIVLTHAIATYDQMGAGRIFDPPAFFHSVGFFLGVLIGSFLLGFVFAVITALLTKFTRLHESPLLETSVFFLLSWSSFLSAEACGLSGIVAVLFCGLSQARYTILNLSHEGRTRTKQLFEVFNFLGEIFIFSYMGYIWFTFPHHVFEALFILGAFLSIFISRACNIYSLSFLLNLGRTNKISWAVQHFMVFAGLRGVIAFSLAIRDTSTEVKKTILTTTLLLVVFTVWVLGAAADPLLRRLDLRVEEEEADEDPQEVPFEDDQGMPDATRGLWHCLDHQYLKPLLTHCGPPLTDSLPRWCGGFAKVFSSSRLQEDEEQLCEAQPDASTVSLEKTELTSTRSDSGSEHQEDLLEGDLGLGAGVSPRPEFPGVSSNDDLSSPPPTAHGDTGQGI